MLVRPQIRDGLHRSLSVGRRRDWRSHAGSVGERSEAMRLQWLGLAACGRCFLHGLRRYAARDAAARRRRRAGSRRPRTRGAHRGDGASRPICRSVHRTGGVGYGTGSAFPGPQKPFGMVRPGPDTMQSSGAIAFSHCSGYAYGDPFIYGFSHTRMHGTGIVDYGTIGLMPTIGMTAAKTTGPGERWASPMTRRRRRPALRGRARGRNESSSPRPITWRSIAIPFPSSTEATVLIDIGHALPNVKITDGHVEIDPTQPLITGFAHLAGGYSDRYGGMPVYFAARFTRPFAQQGVWKAGVLAPGELSRDGGDTGAWSRSTRRRIPWSASRSPFHSKTAAHARQNLDAEAPVYDFDGTATASEAAWRARSRA